MKIFNFVSSLLFSFTLVFFSFSSHASSAINFLSYEKFSSLKKIDQVRYVKEIINSYKLIDQYQEKSGIQFSQNLNFLIQNSWADSGDSNCNCGGFIKQKSDKLKVCICNRCSSGENQGSRDYFQCNPILFGDTCVPRSASPQITQACEKSSESKLDDIAKKISQDKSKYESVTKELNTFCDNKKSIECNSIHSRINELNQKLNQPTNPPPPLRTDAASLVVPNNENQVSVDNTFTCGHFEEHNDTCLECPEVARAKNSRFYTLAKIMEKFCPLNPENKNSKELKQPSQFASQNILSTYSGCLESLSKSNDFKSNRENDQKLEANLNKVIKDPKLLKGFISNDYSVNLEAYLGISSVEAANLFCYNNTKIDEIFSGKPNFAYIAKENELTINLDMLTKDHSEITHPEKFISGTSTYSMNRTDMINELKKVRASMLLREKLHSCMKSNERVPSNKCSHYTYSNLNLETLNLNDSHVVCAESANNVNKSACEKQKNTWVCGAKQIQKIHVLKCNTETVQNNQSTDAVK